MLSRNRNCVRGFVTVIHQAEIAYRELLGGNRVKLEPGLRLDLPILHSIKRIDMREGMVPIPNLHAYTKDNVPVLVNGTLFYKPVDAEKACYEVSDYKDAIAKTGESCFRAVVGNFEFDQIIAQRNELNNELMRVIGKSVARWGMECGRCEVQHFGPQNTSVAQQLEKQMEAERRRRENELDTQARIRTAEGAKAQAVLVSEGELVAAKNRSEGAKIETTLKSEGELAAAKNRADAAKYQMDMEAKALADQVAILTKVTKNEEMAINLLLERKRLEHLQAMAQKDNRIYFVDPEGSLPKAIPLIDSMYSR